MATEVINVAHSGAYHTEINHRGDACIGMTGISIGPNFDNFHGERISVGTGNGS